MLCAGRRSRRRGAVPARRKPGGSPGSSTDRCPRTRAGQWTPLALAEERAYLSAGSGRTMRMRCSNPRVEQVPGRRPQLVRGVLRGPRPRAGSRSTQGTFSRCVSLDRPPVTRPLSSWWGAVHVGTADRTRQRNEALGVREQSCPNPDRPDVQLAARECGSGSPGTEPGRWQNRQVEDSSYYTRSPTVLVRRPMPEISM